MLDLVEELLQGISFLSLNDHLNLIVLCYATIWIEWNFK